MTSKKLPHRGTRRSAIARFALLINVPAFGETPKPPGKESQTSELEALIVSALRKLWVASMATASSPKTCGPLVLA